MQKWDHSRDSDNWIYCFHISIFLGSTTDSTPKWTHKDRKESEDMTEEVWAGTQFSGLSACKTIGIGNSAHSLDVLKAALSLHFQSTPNINYDILGGLVLGVLTFDTVWVILVFHLLIWILERLWKDKHKWTLWRTQQPPLRGKRGPLKRVGGLLLWISTRVGISGSL